MYCDKFEELFIQETDEELLKHIQECETCMLEYKKMLKVESVIKEVKPVFAAQKRNKALTKIAASMALVVISSFVLLNNFNSTKICYEDSSAFPVDEYGLLDIQ